MKEGKLICLADDLFFLGRDSNDSRMGSVVLKLVGYIANKSANQILIFKGNDNGLEIYKCESNGIYEYQDMKLEPVTIEIENIVCIEIAKLLYKEEVKWRKN